VFPQRRFQVPLQYRTIDGKVPYITFDVIKDQMIDSTIGTGYLDLAPLALHSGQPLHAWIPLGKDGSDGEVLVNAQYFERVDAAPHLPFSPSDMEKIWKRGHVGDVLATIVAARNLRNVDKFGEQDPFVRVRLRGEGGRVRAEGETEHRKDAGKQARFDQDFPFSYDDQRGGVPGVELDRAGQTPMLEVEVLDHNDRQQHGSIGRVEIPVFPWYVNFN